MRWAKLIEEQARKLPTPGGLGDLTKSDVIEMLDALEPLKPAREHPSFEH